MQDLYIFLSSIIYKIGIRDGFLFENPEFDFKSPVLFLILFFGYYFFNNYKKTIYVSSFLLFLITIYSTFKYRNNFHFSPNCEIYDIYKSGANPYDWNRLGWDVLHPPNILKFYSFPCELIGDFKLMNVSFLIFLIFTMLYVNRRRSDGLIETLFEITFLISILRIYEGHAYLYILPFAYYSLKNVFINQNKLSFLILGFIYGFRIIPFLLLIPFIYKFYKKHTSYFLIGGMLPFLPLTFLDISIYKSFVENILSQRILTLSNSYFAQNIWNLNVFSGLNSSTRYALYFSIAFSVMWIVYRSTNKINLYAIIPFIISLSPRAVPYEMFILIPFLSILYKKHFFIYFYFLSFAVQVFFVFGAIFGEDSFLNISSVIFFATSSFMVLKREKIV